MSANPFKDPELLPFIEEAEAEHPFKEGYDVMHYGFWVLRTAREKQRASQAPAATPVPAPQKGDVS